MKIGIISDTHNTFDEPLKEFLAPCDEIWHAGDFGSLELADEIAEVKSICACGEKATVNARFGENGDIVVEGEQVELGGNDKYVSICWKCYYKAIHKEK